MKKSKYRKIFSIIASFSLLLNVFSTSLLYARPAYAQEENPEVPLEEVVEPTPTPTLEAEPVVEESQEEEVVEAT